MENLDSRLLQLANVFEKRLAGDLNARFAHHAGHMAPERWLCLELAYLVNTEGPAVGLPGWRAGLERRNVDVTLYSPDESEAIYLEFKLVPADCWNNWREVYKDLGHSQIAKTGSKPVAHAAVCILYDHILPKGKPRQSSLNKYKEYIGRIPDKPGIFRPLDDPNLPDLYLAVEAPKFRLIWNGPNEKPLLDTWIRLLWVTLAPSEIIA